MLAELVAALQHGRGPIRSIGIGMPGLIGADGVPIRVANLPWLEGRPLQRDLHDALQVPVAVANDANCLALSEAVDGAAAGAGVFGAILGTGVGGGIVVEGKPLAGANATAGEWGHNPRRGRARKTARRSPAAAAGRAASRPGSPAARSARDYRNVSGGERSAAEVARLAEAGEFAARTALARYQRRLAAALAGVINLRSRRDRARRRPVVDRQPVRASP